MGRQLDSHRQSEGPPDTLTISAMWLNKPILTAHVGWMTARMAGRQTNGLTDHHVHGWQPQTDWQMVTCVDDSHRQTDGRLHDNHRQRDDHLHDNHRQGGSWSLTWQPQTDWQMVIYVIATHRLTDDHLNDSDRQTYLLNCGGYGHCAATIKQLWKRKRHGNRGSAMWPAEVSVYKPCAFLTHCQARSVQICLLHSVLLSLWGVLVCSHGPVQLANPSCSII